MSNVEKGTGEMTDAELIADIDNARGEGHPDNPEPDEPDEGTKTETQPEPTKEPAISGQPEETTVVADPIQSKLDNLIKRLDDLAQENRNLQKYNGHLSNEVGVLRRKAESTPALPSDTDMLENPVESTQKVVRATLEAEKKTRQEQSEATNRNMMAIAETVQKYAPDFEKHIESMALLLEGEGQPKDIVEKFRHNPVAVVSDPGVLINLAHRAIEHKKNVELEKTIADLKKQLEDAGQGTHTMAKNLKRASQSGPEITSRNVKAPKNRVENIDFSKMTYAELKKSVDEDRLSVSED